jgi:carbamoyltransferase
MQGAYLGPAFTDVEAQESLEGVEAVYTTLQASDLYPSVAELLAKGHVVGWFQGRMEFGPRALGARSIIGDPRNIEMQSVMNLKIKYRESFRPFAPAVLAERIADYFEQAEDSPYMLLVANVREMLRKQVSAKDNQLFGIDKLNVLRSELPAITHIDYSARIQSVHKETNPQFHALLSAFDQLTGCGVLVNTSFNVRGEPIVCTPLDAYRCFMRTEMDSLVIGNMVFSKVDQPTWNEEEDWRETFELD